MEILSKKNAFWGTVRVTPNLRFTVPDEIGAALVSRGMAEDITAITEEMAEDITAITEEMAEEKPKKKAKGG